MAKNRPGGPWWLLGWCERVPEADEVLPAPLPPYRVLTGLVDRFGRTQTFHREAAGEFSGEITGVRGGGGGGGGGRGGGKGKKEKKKKN
ncbi:hypothetical protein RBJ41_21745 [Escherichia coli]|nr:hypothetical protein [Escherichia coli]MDT0839804.1 hypothetical protein [Escherichia coli]